MTTVFADQHYVEQIRKKLWCGREFGQAAVFVGAGYSRNARPISPNTPPFAMWSELAGKMFDTLYPPSTFGSQESFTLARLKATSGDGSLKIAQEFELSMGRPALDHLISQAVPDNDYYPGELHELLLTLPWSDVFTTNYDTLLERTRPRIYERKYDLVLTASDIPGAMKPRIVKLHGSFPSHRPYIITEEDFRTYPSEFGPFVNTVQQAIMENSMCLLGFSGDDPNFLYWSGWVRDNLGASTPPIYLVGLLGLSSAQRKVLESRRVVPIDLSPLFPVSAYPVSVIRHQKAMEWFLLNLMHGAPPTTHIWPTHRSRTHWKSSGGLPPIPPGPAPLHGPGPRGPEQWRLPADQILSIIEVWKEIRLQCPGWLVLPEPNRTELWDHTVRWIQPILVSLEDLTVPQRLQILFELHWRVAACRGPMTASFATKIDEVLLGINPFPGVIHTREGQITPTINDPAEHHWDLWSEYWGELAFALLRHYRDTQNEEAFMESVSKLQGLLKHKQEWELHWHYEQCLLWLNRGSLEKLKKSIQSWPARPDNPVWEMRRAAILAETGELTEAEGIAERALAEIRSRLRPNSMDVGPLSHEGWAMLLLEIIKGNELGGSDSYRGEYRDRWEKLGTFRCNPWSILEHLEAGLLKAANEPRSVVEVDCAHALIRLFEEAGIPIRCGSVQVGGDKMLSAAQQLAPYFPSWALGVMLRVGNNHSVEDWFNQRRIILMTPDELSEICSRLLVFAREALQITTRRGVDFWSPDLAQRQLPLFCEVLARLCLRLSSHQKLAVLDLACQLYLTPMLKEHHILHKCVESLIKGAVPQLLPSELESKMTQLLELPVPEDAGFDVAEPQMWPEPFQYVRWTEGASAHVPSIREDWRKAVDKLLQIIEVGTKEARTRAVLRLTFLHDIGGLDPESVSGFQKALWSRLDTRTRLPADTGLYNFAFLALPAPDSTAAVVAFRSIVINGDFHRSINRRIDEHGRESMTFGVGMHDTTYFNELLGSSDLTADTPARVSWSSLDASHLLDKAIKWWTEEGSTFVSNEFWDLMGTGSRRLELFVRVLERVIIPRLAPDEEILNQVFDLLKDMEQHGVCIMPVLPMTLLLSPEMVERVALQLRSGLNSWNHDVVTGAIEGVYGWLAISQAKGIDGPPADIVKECVDIVVTRRQPGLDIAISIVSDMVQRFPGIMLAHLAALHVGLEYLLTATALPDGEQTSSSGHQTIPVEDRIRYRALAARLAFSVHTFLEPSMKVESAPIITEWKSISEATSIASIRRAWIS